MLCIKSARKKTYVQFWDRRTVPRPGLSRRIFLSPGPSLYRSSARSWFERRWVGEGLPPAASSPHHRRRQGDRAGPQTRLVSRWFVLDRCCCTDFHNLNKKNKLETYSHGFPVACKFRLDNTDSCRVIYRFCPQGLWLAEVYRSRSSQRLLYRSRVCTAGKGSAQGSEVAVVPRGLWRVRSGQPGDIDCRRAGKHPEDLPGDTGCCRRSFWKDPAVADSPWRVPAAGNPSLPFAGARTLYMHQPLRPEQQGLEIKPVLASFHIMLIIKCSKSRKKKSTMNLY